MLELKRSLDAKGHCLLEVGPPSQLGGDERSHHAWRGCAGECMG